MPRLLLNNGKTGVVELTLRCGGRAVPLRKLPSEHQGNPSENHAKP
jgi:hypothetical protein